MGDLGSKRATIEQAPTLRSTLSTNSRGIRDSDGERFPRGSMCRTRTSLELRPEYSCATAKDNLYSIMASSQSRVAELAATVAQNTQLIDSYLADKDLPYPSFDATGPTDLGLPPDLDEARVAVLQATQELNDLLQGPRNLVENHQVCQP